MQYASDAETRQIHQRQMELLSSQARTALIGGVLAITLISVLVWSEASPIATLTWSAILISTVGIRVWKIAAYRRLDPQDGLRPCLHYYSRSLIVSGTAWGLMFAYLAYLMNITTLIYPIMILCALAAGNSMTYNAHFNPFRNFAIPALLLPALVLIASPNPQKFWLGILLVCWFMMMYSISIHLIKFLSGTERYEIENIALIRDLEYQREHSERLKEELRLKTEIIQRLAQQSRQDQSPDTGKEKQQRKQAMSDQ